MLKEVWAKEVDVWNLLFSFQGGPSCTECALSTPVGIISF